MDNCVIIGAGVAGLSAAAVLARTGLNVTVFEAHVDPGGCASTFYHQGYRFDAGATLAGGFYPGGPMDLVAQAAGLAAWPGVHLADTAMQVYLPGKPPLPIYGDERRWKVRMDAFSAAGDPFWQWQESTANALWDLALRLPPWPPQSTQQLAALIQRGADWIASEPRVRLGPHLLLDAMRPVSAHLKNAPASLRQFVDAQLLISAQATSQHANALYGASALDLPRRGVVHLEGGMGAIAQALVNVIRQNKGSVIFRQEVRRVVRDRGRILAVETRRGDSFPADIVVANLTPWNIAALLNEDPPRRLLSLPEQPQDGWGAFMLYLGLDGTLIPSDFPLHHQVVLREPFGEGNTAFLSFSPQWDLKRAPLGQRAVTLSTHTRLQPWWRLFETDCTAYERLKNDYTQRLLQAAEIILPGIRSAARLVLPGTPVTFERFTRRAWGWVGGYPQTSLLRAWGPHLAPNLWMVGDSIFPGQSTAAAALGGLRVANTILNDLGIMMKRPQLIETYG